MRTKKKILHNPYADAESGWANKHQSHDEENEEEDEEEEEKKLNHIIIM